MTLNCLSNDIIERYMPAEAVSLYLDEAQNANRKFNLFSRQLKEEDLRQLIAESLIVLDRQWLSDSATILDIGSGWGIPAVPILLAGFECDMTFLERSEKKAGFLSLALHKLKPFISCTSYEVIGLDLESYQPQKTFDYIIMRQVAADDRLLRHIKRISSQDAELIIFGSSLPDQIKTSSEIISYTIDGLAERKIVKTKIS